MTDKQLILLELSILLKKAQAYGLPAIALELELLADKAWLKASEEYQSAIRIDP